MDLRYNPRVAGTLVVSEIYLSLQGESTFAGLPCVFVRLTGCDLRCSWCDTAYAFNGGNQMALEEIRGEIEKQAEGYPGPPLVEITGGEPMLQKETHALMAGLCDDGYTVLLETSGAHDLTGLDPRVHRIIDLKCPASGEHERNHWANFQDLRPSDEIKAVIATHDDYTWAKSQLHRINGACPVLFSWAAPLADDQKDPSLKPIPTGHPPITRRELAEAVIRDRLPVRFQLQQHKHIWPSDKKGV